jgi:polyisoprenoid-binding protein YceI
MKISKNHARLMVLLHSLSLLIVLVAFAAFATSSSEEELSYRNADARIAITGFNNLNHWGMETELLQCSGSFVFLNGELEDISSLTFSTAVKSLRSDHSEMDSIVYQVLSDKGTEDITFVQTQQMVLPRMRMVNIIGNLTIANITQKVDLQFSYTIGKDKALHFKGLNKVDLNQFGITPAHPLLKALKFDNQILVQIEMTLNNHSDLKLNTKNTKVTAVK